MLQPLKVHGKACPFNEKNCYDEILASDAFDDFLKTHTTLPVCVMHHDRKPVGTWTKLEKRADGLYVEGEIYDPIAQELVKEGIFPELSVSFKALDHSPETFTEARLNAFRAEGKPEAQIRKAHSLPCVTTHKARLAEISLVDHGAYDGTYLTLD